MDFYILHCRDVKYELSSRSECVYKKLSVFRAGVPRIWAARDGVNDKQTTPAIPRFRPRYDPLKEMIFLMQRNGNFLHKVPSSLCMKTRRGTQEQDCGTTWKIRVEEIQEALFL